MEDGDASILPVDTPSTLPELSSRTFRLNELAIITLLFVGVFLLCLPQLILRLACQDMRELVDVMGYAARCQALAIEVWCTATLDSIRQSTGAEFLDRDKLEETFHDSQATMLDLDQQFLGTDHAGARELYTDGGLSTKIARFVELSNAFFRQGDLLSESYRELSLYLLQVVDPAFTEFRAREEPFADEEASKTRSGVRVIYALGFIVVTAVFILGRILENSHLSNLRTTVILLRHIPPPRIAQTPNILSLVLPQPPVEDIQDVSQTAFEQCSLPAVCLSENLIVNAVNQAFVSTFAILPGFILGQPLTILIPKPLSDDGKLVSEDRAAFHFHNRLAQMAVKDTDRECSYATKCLKGEQFVAAQVTAHAVKGAGFVLFIEDSRQTDEVGQKLEDKKRLAEYLEAQLMPVDLNSVNIDGAKSGTLLAVQIRHSEILSKAELAELFSVVEVLAKNHPPFIAFNILFDTVYVVGGLFLDSADPRSHAEPAIGLAKSIAEEFQQSTVQFAMGITIANDFAVTVTKGDCPILDVASPAIDDVTDLVVAAPGDAIIVSAGFAELIAGGQESGFHPGPTVREKQSFLL
jgi:hypothetical protein